MAATLRPGLLDVPCVCVCPQGKLKSKGSPGKIENVYRGFQLALEAARCRASTWTSFVRQHDLNATLRAVFDTSNTFTELAANTKGLFLSVFHYIVNVST